MPLVWQLPLQATNGYGLGLQLAQAVGGGATSVEAAEERMMQGATLALPSLPSPAD